MKRALKHLTVVALVLFFSMTILSAHQAGATGKEDYPNKTITWICPFGAGGGTDRWSRTIASVAIDHFGEAIRVVNIPGASAVVGWKQLLNRPADGYTIMQGSSTPVLSLLLEGEKRPLNPDEIKICCYISAFRSIMITKPDNPWSDWEGFQSYVKENPGELTIGGTLSLLTGPANFFDQLGIEVTFVPYKDTGSAVTDMLGGHIDVAAVTGSTADTVVPEEATAIFNTSGVPIPKEKFKDLPNAKDVGVKGMVFPRWIGIHPDSPDWMAQFISDKIGEISQSKSFTTLVEKMGEEIIYLPKSKAEKEFQDMINIMEEKLKLLQ